MGKRSLVALCAVGLLAGATTGPGYWAYARYFAGQELTRVQPLDASAAGIKLALSPEMNPILLRMDIDASRPVVSGRYGVAYKVRLGNGNQALVEETVSFRRERKRNRSVGKFGFFLGESSNSQTVAVFRVPAAGEYTLAVEETRAPEIHKLDVANVRCVLRRNTVPISAGLCVFGFALFVVSGLVVVASTGNLHFALNTGRN